MQTGSIPFQTAPDLLHMTSQQLPVTRAFLFDTLFWTAKRESP